MRSRSQLNRKRRSRKLGYSDSQVTAALEALESRVLLSAIMFDADGSGVGSRRPARPGAAVIGFDALPAWCSYIAAGIAGVLGLLCIWQAWKADRERGDGE